MQDPFEGNDYDQFEGNDYDQFKKKVLALTSLDLDIYRPSQLQRRLQSLLKKKSGHDL